MTTTSERTASSTEGTIEQKDCTRGIEDVLASAIAFDAAHSSCSAEELRQLKQASAIAGLREPLLASMGMRIQALRDILGPRPESAALLRLLVMPREAFEDVLNMARYLSGLSASQLLDDFVEQIESRLEASNEDGTVEFLGIEFEREGAGRSYTAKVQRPGLVQTH